MLFNVPNIEKSQAHSDEELWLTWKTHRLSYQKFWQFPLWLKFWDFPSNSNSYLKQIWLSPPPRQPLLCLWVDLYSINYFHFAKNKTNLMLHTQHSMALGSCWWCDSLCLGVINKFFSSLQSPNQATQCAYSSMCPLCLLDSPC